MLSDLSLIVLILIINGIANGLRQILFQIVECSRQQVSHDLGPVLVGVDLTEGGNLGGYMDRQTQRELLGGQGGCCLVPPRGRAGARFAFALIEC